MLVLGLSRGGGDKAYISGDDLLREACGRREQLMDGLHSHHFEVRGDEEACVDVCKIVPEHSWVKVGCSGERFWCKVDAVDKSGAISVTVDNQLIGDHGFNHGSRLAVHSAHVLDILNVADMEEYQRLASTFGNETDGALAWWTQRVCERGER